MTTEELSLREKKYARTKIGLMNSFLKHLKTSRFEDISIKEICQEAEVAETTFFNYFPEKIDMVGYYIQLITKKTIAQALKDTPRGKTVALINNTFSLWAVEMGNVNMLYQIIAVVLLQNEKLKKVPVSSLEVRLAFSEDSDSVSSDHIDDFFFQMLKEAVQRGELPVKTKIEDIVVSLMSILIGTLVAVKFLGTNSMGYHYKRQLNALWDSIKIKR